MPRELKESKNVQLTAAECLGVFHISSAAKQAIAEEQQRSRSVPKYVSKSEKREKGRKKLARQMTCLHHTTSLPPPVIHKASPTLCFSPPARALARSPARSALRAHTPASQAERIFWVVLFQVWSR